MGFVQEENKFFRKQNVCDLLKSIQMGGIISGQCRRTPIK